jgi:N-acetylmuramoyl-L-alanine amidase CwlA
MNIQWIGTPDYTKGHKNYDFIVMHWGVVTNIQQIDNEVLNPNREMSYHYALDKSVVHQYVDEANTAWHAGVWDINQRSVGVCIAAGPNYPYVDADYETAAQLCAEIIRRHPSISLENIKGHKDFKATECPGNLDLTRLRNRVSQILNPKPIPAPIDPKDTEIARLNQLLAVSNSEKAKLLTELNTCKANLTLNENAVKELKKKLGELDTIFDTYRKDSADEIARLTKELKEIKEKAVADLLVKQKKIDQLEQAIKDSDLSKLSFWEKIILLFS